MAPPDPPPGPDATGGPALKPPARPRHADTPPPSPNDKEPAAILTVHPGKGADVTLPWDQVPPEHRTIGDATGRLDGHLGVTGVALAQWMARDDTKAQPAIRQAANVAMGAIDAMLAELHQLRARLVTEVRESDDLAAVRADALLARSRAVLGREDPP